MNINSTNCSSANIRLLPCTGRTVPNPLAGSIASVRNQSVDFDSKPSCWSFVWRALASLLRKIVSVCQAIPHKLALLVPCYDTSIVRTTDSAKESHKVNPLPKPPRTFEYKSKVSDVENPPFILNPTGEDAIAQKKQENYDLELNLSLSNYRNPKKFLIIHTRFAPIFPDARLPFTHF
ncbi:hypothetical protein SODG_001790 [Sodalis praecaptivus]|uniref:hypothetical protein n=1 Tax=Sodalis praecaptivus TaxID=1239307 RepID=UPI00280B4C88|nr:hypothetical protein [Sodalis praecaptivus]